MQDVPTGLARPTFNNNNNPPSAILNNPETKLLLTSLQLLAVQPACLEVNQVAALAVPHQHHLLLQLAATVASAAPFISKLDVAAAASPEEQPPPSPPRAAAAAAAAKVSATTSSKLPGSGFSTESALQWFPVPSSSFPALQLPCTLLSVAVLNKHMQQIVHSKISLMQLFNQQLTGDHSCVGHDTASNGNFARLPGSSTDGSNSSFSISIASGFAVSNTASTSMMITVRISFPAQINEAPLDAHHLLLTVQEVQQQRQQQRVARGGSSKSNGSGSSNSDGNSGSSNGNLGSSGVLLADVPLLLLPAVAKQEVHQLLLPSMRQEAQVEALQQLEATAAGTDELDLGALCMHVESLVWQHFQQLTRDIYSVTQVAAAAAAAAQGAQEQLAAPAGTGPTSAGVQVWSDCGPALPVAALQQLATALIFPMLLPFLAAHGMRHTQQLLLDCLPQVLQEQWRQQQLEHLRSLASRSALMDSSAAGEGGHAGSGTNSPKYFESGALQQGHEELPWAAPGSSQQQQPATGEATPATCSCPASSGSGASIVNVTSSAAPVAAAATCAADLSAVPDPGMPAAGSASLASADVPWHLPFIGFPDSSIESRYVIWKHRRLLHLDYLCAGIKAFYLVALLRRMLREPVTLFMCLFVLLKMLPHVPLMLGFNSIFLGRHRELWLALTGPACVLLVWFSAAVSLLVLHQQPLLFSEHTIKSFWGGRGELFMGMLRPFIVHMRLRVYVAYVCLDAVAYIWGFGQVYGLADAVCRWGLSALISVALCWAFELYMRRLFIFSQQGWWQPQHGQQQQGQGRTWQGYSAQLPAEANCKVKSV